MGYEVVTEEVLKMAVFWDVIYPDDGGSKFSRSISKMSTILRSVNSQKAITFSTIYSKLKLRNA
jgi:hypothetical protein